MSAHFYTRHMREGLLKNYAPRARTAAKRQRIFQRDNHRCVWCESTNGPLTLDHILPKSKGGSHDPTNLVTCCEPCNRRRGQADAVAFAQTFPDPAATLARVRSTATQPLNPR